MYSIIFVGEKMLSIKNNDMYEETIKNSKFISLIFRIYSKDDVKNYLDFAKKKYPNATHYCFGYIINNDIKSSDDGEPAKTAGLPILNQIIYNNLNYTLIIVVRYFGGIKLGTGLLTRTYSKCAANVIKKDNIIKLVKGYDITITFDYSNIKDIDYILSSSRIISKSFDNNIIYNVYVTKEVLDKLSIFDIKINKEIFIEE